MFDAMFPAARAASLDESTRRPYQPPGAPGTFAGFGSALADIVPNAVLTTGNAWSGILDAYGKAAAYRDAPAAAMLAGRPAPNMADLQKQTIDQMGNNQLGPDLRAEAKKYAPDPLTVGTAGQIVFGVGTSLAKAGAYSLTGPAAPVLFGADVGVNRADELKDQGVDSTTANLAGVVSGVAGAVGMKLPAALGATRLQSAAIGAVTNPALNVAEVGGIRMLLNHADYPRIAARYQPFDPVSLAIASITGAAFGAAFHGGKARSRDAEVDAPVITPEEHAAALTMHEVHTREADTLVDPTRVAESNAGADAQVRAREQMDAGEPVSVAPRVDVDPVRAQAAVSRITEGPIGEVLRAAVDDQGPVSDAAPAGPAEADLAASAVQPDVPQPADLAQQIAGTVSHLVGPVAEQGASKPDTPEQARALEIVRSAPDVMIPTGDLDAQGNPVHARASDLLQHADEIQQQAQTEAKAFKAAVNCALRYT